MFYVKKKIVFYEKPGCLGNKKQKELLKENGLELEVKSILDTKWDKKTLESFFIGLEKHEIVNESAPKIKKGEIDLNSITKEQLIYKMISDPILIKRPLIIAGESNICGFDIEKLNESLNLNISTTKKLEYVKVVMKLVIR
jgi:nitrogenase-associated protein